MNAVLASRDLVGEVTWCKDVFSALYRAIQANGASVGEGPAKELLNGSAGPGGGISESDLALLRLSDTAVNTLMQMLTLPLPIGPNNAMPPHVSEVLFLTLPPGRSQSGSQSPLGTPSEISRRRRGEVMHLHGSNWAETMRQLASDFRTECLSSR